MVNQRNLKRAQLVLVALAALYHGHAKAQGVGLREPLFPRRDAATAEYDQPASLTFFTKGSQGTAKGEQELFVPLSGYGTGHLFGGVDTSGKPTFVQAGAALKLHDALTGGVTLIAPASATASLTPGLKLKLRDAGITLKAGMPIDLATDKNYQGQFVAIKGFDMKALQAALRLGGGTTKDADATLSLQRGPIVLEGGVKRSFGAGAATIGKGRVVLGTENMYVAGAVEGGRNVEKLFTVSLGAQFEPGGRKRRQESERKGTNPTRRFAGANVRAPGVMSRRPMRLTKRKE